MKPQLKRGARDSIPIALGYFSVSFAFGIMVVNGGLAPWVGVGISMTNLTSAGQFAGVAMIMAGAGYLEIALTIFVINARYLLMSLSLAQKLEDKITRKQRYLIAFGVTDEIFAVASSQKGNLAAPYMAGLIIGPYWGWALGTLAGTVAGFLLPISVRSALGIALYAMFVAIVVPAARNSRPVLVVSVLAASISCLFCYVPVLQEISPGWVIIVCGIAASALGAVLFPLEQGENGEEEQP